MSWLHVEHRRQIAVLKIPFFNVEYFYGNDENDMNTRLNLKVASLVKITAYEASVANKRAAARWIVVRC